ncbi:hypothetical protein [Nocardioides baculatus]|uniref:ATP-binding protein n=1 Tax=Nocardioides baculatus TaxID=2801337 RepID=A0ABS1LCB3_9ACTN|nr:hypothetical protein [Nocardioides baculatus]MBL0749255.1 hypothetical protein [Nocardioides baculatus]
MEDLEQALTPVAGHFRATEITPNTVLAAHIRALGGKPVGAPWTVAKQALVDGSSFADAAARAMAGQTTEPSRAASSDEHASLAASFSPATHPTLAETVSISPAAVESGVDFIDTDLAEHEPVSSKDIAAAAPLDWFPKVFGPGDIDGEGAKRLLGTPNIPTVSVLVRETAQNSWDARVGHAHVVFRLHLRQATAEERSILRHKVFTGACDGLELTESLAKEDLWLLEITDRGTKGLGGPIRNDLEPPAGASTNFIDLIFNVGAPRDVHLGGGTYGFGKTIAYRASRPGSVVFWTRTHDVQGQLEDRLIGSAIGSSFSSVGLRHTGRHWWGRRVDERIEPVVGAEARTLGSAIFRTGFTESQTGTSLLLIDPDLGGDSPREDVTRLAEACVWHLWPKMVRGQGERVPMELEVWLNGSPVQIPDLPKHPILAGHVDSLSAVRSAQQGVAFTPVYNTTTHEIWCEKPRKLLGHLALTRYPISEPLTGVADLAPVREPSASIALMRHDAELVVKYETFQPLDHPTFQWSGVFKPVADVDDSFALAEPPAHDDWIPASMSDRAQKRDVNVALRRIREQVTEFLRPLASNEDTLSKSTPVAAVADALAGLIGGLEGNAASRRPSKGGERKPASGRPTARVLESLLGDMAEGRRRGYARVACTGKGADPVRLRASIAVGVEGGSDADELLTNIVGWTNDPMHGLEVRGPERSLKPGQESWLVFEFDPALAVDVNVRLAEDEK